MILTRLTSASLVVGLLLALIALHGPAAHAQYAGKTAIAHRGASGYAPEHSAPAYTLAIAQGAEYVEQDLQVTKDGQLVCLHDLTLDRTTDVETVFPGRSRTAMREGRELTGWHVTDFTLAEIKRLDAGSWFDPTFAGERILTFQVAIDIVKGQAGIYPETKAPEVYGSVGFDMERLVMDVLAKNGLDAPGADPKTPVFLQSFSAESLKKMRLTMKVRLPLLFLMGTAEPWLTKEKMAEIRTFADGIGPAKGLVSANPAIVGWAHAAGLSVTPYTFRTAGQPAGQTVRGEMEQYLHTFGVDALFTDNPDLFPRR